MKSIFQERLASRSWRRKPSDSAPSSSSLSSSSLSSSSLSSPSAPSVFTRAHNHNPRSRRAITIIEVTFSIGVVIVGVLGVVTLIPLAHRQAERGIALDRASSTATEAVEAFGVRGMAYPPSWRLIDPELQQLGFNTNSRLVLGSVLLNGQQVPVFEKQLARLVNGNWVWTNASAVATPQQFLNATNSVGRPLFWLHIGNGFCIDGRFMSLPGNRLVSTTENGNQIPLFGRYFPYTPEQPGIAPFTTITTRLRRVGLRAFPSITPAIMSALQADEVFVSRDDLTFRKPDDNTLPPVQIGYDPGPDGAWGVAGVDDNNNNLIDENSEAGWLGSDDQVYQRQYTGGFSWFATLTPKFVGEVSYRDLYTLNIVVVQNRKVSMWTAGPDEAWGVAGQDDDGNGRIDDIADAGGGDDLIDAVSERVAFIGFVGVPGGATTEAILVSRPGRNALDLDVKVGNWIMVAATASGAQPNNLSHVSKWYRITNATAKPEPFVINNNTFTSRRITIAGPDWDPNHFTFADQNNGSRFAEATIMPAVLNVHEKTVRLESSSLWTID